MSKLYIVRIHREKEEMESSEESDIEMDTEDLHGRGSVGKHDLMMKGEVSILLSYSVLSTLDLWNFYYT